MPKTITEKLSYKEAPIPADEKDRLQTLKELKILDTVPEDRFDRITKLALDLFNVPISTVTLVDSHREWFKSCQGLLNREGKRAVSFCGHALLSEDVFIVEDADKDPRFAKNPMVIHKPFIKFYAGVSLKAANGKRVGAFCIKDYKPRSVTDRQTYLLKSIASWAELELNVHELSSALEARTRAEAKVAELNNALRVLNKTLTHDLLNHLTVIKGLVEVFSKKIKDKKTEVVFSAIESSVNLVKQVRGLESALSGGNSLKNMPIRQVVDVVIASFSSIKFNISGDGIAYADDALTSVVGNIIHNAKVHGKTDRVEISIEQKRDYVEIRIADFGVGIPDDIKDKIFGEGFKYGPAGNSGLGLYITKKTIERYGGEIFVKDNKPKGAVFIIKLKSPF